MNLKRDKQWDEEKKKFFDIEQETKKTGKK